MIVGSGLVSRRRCPSTGIGKTNQKRLKNVKNIRGETKIITRGKRRANGGKKSSLGIAWSGSCPELMGLLSRRRLHRVARLVWEGTITSNTFAR